MVGPRNPATPEKEGGRQAEVHGSRKMLKCFWCAPPDRRCLMRLCTTTSLAQARRRMRRSTDDGRCGRRRALTLCHIPLLNFFQIPPACFTCTLGAHQAPVPAQVEGIES